MYNYLDRDEVKAKLDDMMRQAEHERLVNRVQAAAKRDAMLRRAEYEMPANQPHNAAPFAFRRAIALLAGMMKLPNAGLYRPTQSSQTARKPSKLATDSGIYRIR